MYRAGAVLGPQGEAAVAQLRERGVPDEAIRARLGMGAAPGAAPARPAGYGGVGAPRAPELPEELQRPYETLYPEDYISQLAVAAKQGKITPERAASEAKKFNEWKKSEIGIRTEMAGAQRGAVEEAARQEAARLAIQERQAAAKQEILAEQKARGEADAANAKADKESYDRAYQQRESEYEQTIEEVKRFRVDPMAGRSPVFDAAAAAFSAVASAMLKDPTFLNSTMAAINKRVDNNIRAQETQLKSLQSGARMQANRIGMLRGKFGDDQKAREAERRLQLENVQTQLEELAVEGGSELVRANAKHLSANVDIQLQQMRNEERLGHAVFADQIKERERIGRMNAAYQEAERRKAEKRQVLLAQQGLGGHRPIAKDERKRIIPGIGIAHQGSKVEGLRDEAAAYHGLMRNIAGMKRILDKYGDSDLVMSEDDKKTYARFQAGADVPTLSKVAGAAMSEEEIRRISPMLSPTATDAVARQRYDMARGMAAFETQVESAFKDRMSVHIERPVKIGVDPETRQRQYFVSEGVGDPSAYKTGAGGATVLPGAAPDQ
jgi:hypothetical protein